MLDGARQILMERFAEDAELLGKLREYLADHGVVASTVIADKETDPAAKFRDWLTSAKPSSTVPSHRALALFRGRNEGILRLQLAWTPTPPTAARPAPTPARGASPATSASGTRAARPTPGCATPCAGPGASRSPAPELELLGQLREQAEEEAIRVFGRNLKDLLLAAPAGPLRHPGPRPGPAHRRQGGGGDQTGKLPRHRHHLPPRTPPRLGRQPARAGPPVREAQCSLIAIGNGTASRETDKLAAELIKLRPELRMTKIVVSEAGASVYSASELAARGVPDLDVSLRGAVSIARRLQDPLAELVKIDPNPSASASTSTTSTRAAWRAPSIRWSKTA